MIAAGPVIALLLSMHTCYREPRDEPRLVMIAQSIARVSDSHGDAAALISIGWHESAFCGSVHSGARRGGHGRGLWQIEPGSRRAPLFDGLSREATEHAAGEALWLWRHTLSCGHIGRRFGAYAGLGCRLWPGARSRFELYLWARQRLALAQPEVFVSPFLDGSSK